MRRPQMGAVVHRLPAPGRGDIQRLAADPQFEPEVDFDWMCPDCAADHDRDEDDIENLRAICIHCVRKLRGET